MQIPNSTISESKPPTPADNDRETTTAFSNPWALVQLIFRHWSWLVCSVVLCTLLGGLYAYLATPIYRATARIEILNDSRVETRATTQYDRQERSLSRQMLLLNSNRLHQQVRANLAEEWKKKLTEPERYVEFLVTSVPGSNGTMIDCLVDSVAAEYSKAYLVEMIQGYRSLRMEELMEVNQSALLGLKNEETRVLEDLEQAKQDLETFERENQILFEKERADMDIAFVNQLLARLKSVRLERVLLENQYEQLSDADILTVNEALAATRETEGRSQVTPEGAPAVDPGAETPPEAAKNYGAYDHLNTGIQWQETQVRLDELQNEYKQLAAVFKDTHPRMIDLKGEITKAQSSLAHQNELALKRFEAHYEALKLQEAGIESVLNNWRSEQFLSVANQSEYKQLSSKVAHFERKYNLVYGRLLENTGTTEPFFLRKIQAPQASEKPIKPQVIKIIAASLFLGAAFGAGAILGLEYLKPNPINVTHLEREYHIDLLGQIRRWDLYLPIDKFNPESDIFVAAKGTNQIATETYRRIRLNLLKQFGQDENISFTVTSSQSGDGKTFNVANIALPFAWVGKRVLLIDADLRLGNLTRRLLGRELRHGLADWLADDSCDANIHIVKLKHEPISILPAGVFDDSLPEKVNAARLRGLVHSLQQDYDVIIIDTAPVSIFSESLAFCQATGGVLVMMDSLTSQASVQNCLNELRGIRTLGFCVNGVNESYLRSNGYDAYGSYGTRHIESAFLYGMESETPKNKRWKFR
ncbi:MAG: hypothetical protein CML13_10840 [Puniceicoccaceae bacterium]|nr:hypothetical protein [Puniceicoccaceae bacterium]|tara:strand:- start:58408 stop:60681 length:2274 start_codon:yes stop_codon:yes gene_type:complete